MFKQKIILITGATSGIGRDAALHLAKRGHHVFATGRRVDRLNELDRIDGIEALPLDVTDQASVDNLRGEILSRTEGQGIDVLINNAGYGQNGPLEMLTDEEIRAQFEANVFGLLRVTRAFLPEMRARRAGRIVNIGSVLGLVTIPFTGIYCATKHAVEAINDSLRMELRPFGIQVVLIEPGGIQTEFDDRALESLEPHESPDSPYAEALAGFRAMRVQIAPKKAKTDCIVRAIDKAVAKRRPRTRYRAPFKDSLLTAIQRRLPARWGDAILLTAMRPKKKG
ncbi:SDR family oxidoreductase [Candidatus Sumerlaeota bacterium]|nr:SDR family oxidoreductase [Candidatus Sumerlaeota bacterium]